MTFHSKTIFTRYARSGSLGIPDENQIFKLLFRQKPCNKPAPRQCVKVSYVPYQGPIRAHRTGQDTFRCAEIIFQLFEGSKKLITDISRLLPHICSYSLAVCHQPIGESGSPQQRGPCGENTQCRSVLPGAQTSGGFPGSVLHEDEHTVNSRD